MMQGRLFHVHRLPGINCFAAPANCKSAGTDICRNGETAQPFAFEACTRLPLFDPDSLEDIVHVLEIVVKSEAAVEFVG